MEHNLIIINSFHAISMEKLLAHSHTLTPKENAEMFFFSLSWKSLFCCLLFNPTPGMQTFEFIIDVVANSFTTFCLSAPVEGTICLLFFGGKNKVFLFFLFFLAFILYLPAKKPTSERARERTFTILKLNCENKKCFSY